MIINELARMIEDGEIKGSPEALDDNFPKRRESFTVFDPMRMVEMPLRNGAKVVLREDMPPTYTVIRIEGDKAICMPSGSTDTVIFNLSALIRIQ